MYEESLETLVIHELQHYVQKNDKSGKLLFVDEDDEDQKIWGNWMEKDAVRAGNEFRMCCPELHDRNPRTRYTAPESAQ